ncbi:hypothetical protein [Cyclobacterium plantarum]|uniref:Uncharacterized protein n=1 Tax=Cyclobacterium plantarum TaxID=2716263 RepID=A0ABX0HDG1_9BACT|nr:hypothetical protein [Cyclobacterium plantarum]NHE59350.1 hypothetical protein [Cyclobacterium plantarum]
METEHTNLTNLQREMLGLFAREVSEEELQEIRDLLTSYFAEKAMDLSDRVWDEKGWTAEDAEKMAHSKMRTPYKSDSPKKDS